LSESMYNLRVAANAEEQRIAAYAAMAETFARVDVVISATNPGPAFAAGAATSSTADSFIDWAKRNAAARLAFRGAMGGVRIASGLFPNLPSSLADVISEKFPDLVGMGALTIISNIYGNPAVSIPCGTVDDLPVGMQVLAPHHADDMLFDVALVAEREMPWPLVAT
jgi:Asp-tRNA(Asn)/Glu-tRNA(Gln) amidotransferase A subunit family amidase